MSVVHQTRISLMVKRCPLYELLQGWQEVYRILGIARVAWDI